MMVQTASSGRTLSLLQLALFLVVGALAVAVLGLTFRAYFDGGNTAADVEDASLVITSLANIQREALVLRAETSRVLQEQEPDFQRLELRRGLLANQLRLASVHSENPAVDSGLRETQATLGEFDALFASLKSGTVAEQISSASRIDDVLSRLERQVKVLYDGEEQRFFSATTSSLHTQQNTQILLFAVSGLVLIGGLVLGFSLFRSFRALKNEMAERSRAEERNRQLAENLEFRVTERTSQLTGAMDQLEKAGRHKSEFLANMSHELRTPLNAIIGYSEMLQEQAEEEDMSEFASDLQKIRASGNHLMELVNDVLDISKIEAGKMELYLETFSIPDVVQDVIAVIRPQVEKNGNVLDVSLEENVDYMHADMTKVRQTLFNLMSNASKFTERGNIFLKVACEKRQRADWVSFTVTDTGIGISPEQIERIFEPFSQADASTTRTYGGTGLGLALCHSFCQMMGGFITVDSRVGKGSSFTFSFPKIVVQPQPESGPPEEPGPELVDGKESEAPVIGAS